MDKLSTSIVTRLTAAILVLIVCSTGFVFAEEMSPAVLDFYLGNIKRAIETRNPVEAGTVYSFTTTTLIKYTDSHGMIGRVDTISAEFFHSWGKLDSTKALRGDLKRLEPFVADYENVLDEDYIYNTFPNDTGGIELAIGFDTPSDSLPYPIGMIIVNRDNFVPRWLYLSYPEKKGYSRYSKTWRFTEQNGLIFPDSLCIVAASDGIFGSDYYRVETGVSDLKISSPGETK